MRDEIPSLWKTKCVAREALMTPRRLRCARRGCECFCTIAEDCFARGRGPWCLRNDDYGRHVDCTARKEGESVATRFNVVFRCKRQNGINPYIGVAFCLYNVQRAEKWEISWIPPDQNNGKTENSPSLSLSLPSLPPSSAMVQAHESARSDIMIVTKVSSWSTVRWPRQSTCNDT